MVLRLVVGTCMNQAAIIPIRHDFEAPRKSTSMLQRNHFSLLRQSRGAHLLQELGFGHDGRTQAMPAAIAAGPMAVAAGLKRFRWIVPRVAGLLAAQAAAATA